MQNICKHIESNQRAVALTLHETKSKDIQMRLSASGFKFIYFVQSKQVELLTSFVAMQPAPTAAISAELLSKLQFSSSETDGGISSISE